MLERWKDLLRRRQLLFTPKQYPKYLNNKLRIFTPSFSLKVTLTSVILYSLFAYHISKYSLKEQLFPSEIIIPYPEPTSSLTAPR